MNSKPVAIAKVEMQIEINSPVDNVWRALTDHITDWWPADFYAGGADGAREFKLETWPGGRMYESWEPEGGVLWGTVVTVEPNVRLQVLGTTFPNWGGPSQWYGTWEMSATASGTLLKFSESALGAMGDGYNAEKEKGWQFLWATLKAHLEGKPTPVWTD